MKWGAILHKEWEKYDNNRIKGYWAEDNSRYIIRCPEQLLEQIIEMQNWLSKKYQTYQKYSNKMRELDNFFIERKE